MSTLSLIWGILAFIGTGIAFIPFLGILNWMCIPFSGLGFVVSVIALATTKQGDGKFGSIVGMILCFFSVMIGIVRLLIGGGVV
jgi:hypothetical protein